jgi:aspartyl-tRNA(Asn)/glutamyl-tRNA(Gln) amidotransferase subunit C
MAAIDPLTVERVAKLARLALTDDEKARFVGQLARVVEHFHALRAVASENVQDHGIGASNVLRDDVVTASLPRDEVLAAAPAHDGAFFIVPPVFEPD